MDEQINIKELRETLKRKIFEMSNALNEKEKPIYKNLTQRSIASKVAYKCGMKKASAIAQLSAALSGANYPNILLESDKYLNKLRESYIAKCAIQKSKTISG